LRGAQVHRNHALWEQYLMSYADIAPSHVDWSVDQVEHVLSP
jgi:manganese/zinc/iron transport system permease protein